MQPRMIVEQKITLFTNQYRIYSTDANGQKQQLIAFAQQKRLALKEKIEFYSDESKQQKIFQFRAEKVLDIHGRFLVEDPNNQLIGAFKKDFGQSLAVSTWHILGQNDQLIYTVAENNVTVAVLRRFIGEIPLIGIFAEIAMAFVKYHFAFKPYGGTEEQGIYQKTTLFRDHYLLSTTDQLTQTVDWRVLMSMAVALDALQSR
jgi:uncharacterized protein YxjI